MVQIRHLNRGDIKEGGCSMCKARHQRSDEIDPVKGDVEEGLADLEWWEEVAPWGEDSRT